MNMTTKKINPFEFNTVSTKVKEFFQKKGMIECFVQLELSILAACEDVNNLTTFNYSGQVWPLPQTGQMHLEDILLELGENKVPGIHCTTTSYRQEPNPVAGRHDLIFPMFEFELPCDLDGLIEFEKELLQSLGFGKKESFPEVDYMDMCKKYGVDEIGHTEEKQLYADYGPVVFLKNFPESTSPFWNMKRYPGGELSKKVDVIICGVETIGSAERSCDVEDMKHRFETITGGDYAKSLYEKFGQERVDKELEVFLKHKFFTRSGAGCGVTRLLGGMRTMGLL
jgi:aspartyl/asparaginyl-tRNA synthetase